MKKRIRVSKTTNSNADEERKRERQTEMKNQNSHCVIFLSLPYSSRFPTISSVPSLAADFVLYPALCLSVSLLEGGRSISDVISNVTGVASSLHYIQPVQIQTETSNSMLGNGKQNFEHSKDSEQKISK